MDVFIPYLHYIGIMLVMGALMSEYFLVRQEISPTQIRSLYLADVIYFVALAIVLISGLLRWFVIDVKGAAYFNVNPLFHIKLTLFVIMALLSVIPARRICKMRRNTKDGNTDGISSKDMKGLLLFIRMEMLLLLLIPLLGVMVEAGKHIN